MKSPMTFPRYTLLIGALVASTTLAWAGSVSAETLATNTVAAGSGYSAVDAPLGAPTELHIDLRGQVASRCAVTTPPASMASLAIDHAGTAQADFAIDCNSPFTVRVRSTSGGFAALEPTPGAASLLSYQVAVVIGTDQGRQDLGWCDAGALTDSPAGSCVYAPTGGEGWSSGEATAIDQTGTLRMRWDAPEADQPLLGAYNDVIVIALEVRS